MRRLLLMIAYPIWWLFYNTEIGNILGFIIILCWEFRILAIFFPDICFGNYHDICLGIFIIGLVAVPFILKFFMQVGGSFRKQCKILNIMKSDTRKSAITLFENEIERTELLLLNQKREKLRH